MKALQWFLLGVMGLNSLGVMASGNGGGNGGISIVCRDTNGKIVQAELLDTFELRNLYGLNEVNFLTEDEIMDSVLERLDFNPNYKKVFESNYKRIKKNTKILEDGVQIAPTNDAFPLLRNKNCDFEQLAVYTEDDKLLLDKEIYSTLNVFNRVALLVHETAYYIARKSKADTSSKTARKLTSYLLSIELENDILSKLAEKYIGLETSGPNSGSHQYVGCEATVTYRSEDSLQVKVSQVYDREKCEYTGVTWDFSYNYLRKTWDEKTKKSLFIDKNNNIFTEETEGNYKFTGVSVGY